MITLEPGSEVHRRRTKDRNLVVDRERDRLCPTKEEGRNLRKEIEVKIEICYFWQSLGGLNSIPNQ